MQFPVLALSLWSRYPATFGDARVALKTLGDFGDFFRHIADVWCNSWCDSDSLVTLVTQGRRHARYLLTSSNQRELLKEAGNEIDHGWVSPKLVNSLGEQLKSGKFNDLFSRPGYTSQHKQHQWQKTGHRVGKMCFLIFSQFKDSKEKVWTPILPETFSAVSEPFQLSSWFS